MAQYHTLESVLSRLANVRLQGCKATTASPPLRQTINTLKTEHMLETTFGIELELIIVYRCPNKRYPPRPKPNEESASSTDDQTDCLDLALTSPGQKAIYGAIQAFSSSHRQSDTVHPYRRIPIHNPDDPEYHDGDYSKWQLTTDGSLRLTDAEKTKLSRLHEEVEGVEIVSRTFRADRDDWEAELRTVLDAILSLNGPKMQVLVNSKCGFHVHVGNGLAGLPLATQQKAMLLTTAFERQIDCMHSASRFDTTAASDSDTDDDNKTVYNSGPAANLQRQGYSVRSGLSQIAETTNSPSLAALISANHPKRSAYNLHDVTKHAPPDRLQAHPNAHAIRTLEFRQHRGTLCFDEIRAWTLFTTRLVRVAHETPSADIDALVSRRFADTKYTTTKFLRDLRMHEAHVVRFYARKCRMRGGAAQDVGLANGPLMRLVNREWMVDNSWEIVRAAVRARLESGVYGLESDEAEVLRGNTETRLGVLVGPVAPVWLKGCKVKQKCMVRAERKLEVTC